MLITRVQPEYLQAAIALVHDAVHTMNEQGIYQWDEVYPDASVLRYDIEQEVMYGAFQEETLLGIVVLNHDQLPEYKAIQWSLNDPHPLVIHRLCISPASQKTGIGKNLMKFAEDFAMQNGYRSIRLDAFVNHPAAIRLYESLAYTNRGTIKLRKGLFFCYEKIIGTSTS